MMRENAQTALAQTQKLVYLRTMEKWLLTLLFFACVWNVRATEQTRQLPLKRPLILPRLKSAEIKYCIGS